MELLFRRRSGSTSNMAKMSAADLPNARQEQNIGLSEIEQKLRNWKLPKIDEKDVYKKGIFEFGSDKCIKTEEGSVFLSQDFSKIQLLSSNAIMRLRRQKYDLLHFGLIQIGIKPVSEEGLKGCVLVALRDCSLLKFPDSLLGIVESSLCNGPIFFNCCPNFSVSLTDPHILLTLTLNVKVHGCNMMQHGKSAVAIIYRVHYKVRKTLSTTEIHRFHYKFRKTSLIINDKAVKSDPPGKTLLLETNIHKPKNNNNNSIVPRIIKWDEIEVPDEWRGVNKEEEASSSCVPNQNEDVDPDPVPDPIVTLPDGSTQITFPGGSKWVVR